MENHKQISLQAKVFDFALTELVREHRTSFQPLWSVDSWVKFLIWMALNCGLSGEKESLELFADAMGSSLTVRMRRLFFERTLDELKLQVMADPSDDRVLIMPISGSENITYVTASQALGEVGLLEKVVPDQSCWQDLDAIIAIPWQSSEAVS